MSTADYIALASLLVALVALVISLYAIKRGNATASAATFVTLNEGFRQAWRRYLGETEQTAIDYEMAELLNLTEIACAIYLERSLSGNSRVLALDYLNRVLRLMIEHKPLNDRVRHLLQSKETFSFVRKFLKKKRPGLSVTVPPEWYELLS